MHTKMHVQRQVYAHEHTYGIQWKGNYLGTGRSPAGDGGTGDGWERLWPKSIIQLDIWNPPFLNNNHTLIQSVLKMSKYSHCWCAQIGDQRYVPGCEYKRRCAWWHHISGKIPFISKMGKKVSEKLRLPGAIGTVFNWSVAAESMDFIDLMINLQSENVTTAKILLIRTCLLLPYRKLNTIPQIPVCNVQVPAASSLSL